MLALKSVAALNVDCTTIHSAISYCEKCIPQLSDKKRRLLGLISIQHKLLFTRQTDVELRQAHARDR